MTKFVIRRAIQAIPVLFGITIVVYGILLAAPGGPQAKFANNPRMTQSQKDAFIKAWGLDQPITTRYVLYFANLLQGNLGTTIT